MTRRSPKRPLRMPRRPRLSTRALLLGAILCANGAGEGIAPLPHRSESHGRQLSVHPPPARLRHRHRRRRHEHGRAALQFALGPKGLGQLLENPQRAWVEAMPENRSYIRKLASEFPFSCPLFGEDLKFLIRQGNLRVRRVNSSLATSPRPPVLFDKVLKEGARSLPVLRGLGLSLARLGRYDDAFVHLRTAHEMEEEKERTDRRLPRSVRRGGKPPRPEDKLQNIAWAIRLVTQFNAPGDPEWIGILNRIFAEAREHAIPLTRDDQLYLCEHLVSCKSCDAVSAQAYHFFIASEPHLMNPEYAWLYCRADEQHQVGGDRMLDLYTLTFSNPEPACGPTSIRLAGTLTTSN